VVFAPMLETNRRRPLDAGTPDTAARGELERLSIETAFAHATVNDRDMASCCISGVWLLHDFLDESHTVSQSIETPSGSYWHAIMHRREGDFSNSKYWLRRVGGHPVIELISQRIGSPYDPFAFVDCCEGAIHGKSADREACLDTQQSEWELLFDFCYRAAIAPTPA
jgi:hypothetical protein